MTAPKQASQQISTLELGKTTIPHSPIFIGAKGKISDALHLFSDYDPDGGGSDGA